MIYLKPLQRTIKRGMSGSDVLATKRGLRKAGFRAGVIYSRPKAGSAWQRAVRRFQAKHGLRQDGQIGPATWKVLRIYVAQEAYATWLWNKYTKPRTPTVTYRRSIVDAALFAARHEREIHYTQSSYRMYGVRNHVRPPAIPRYEDCSSLVTWLYWVAGAPDPNGLGYNGQGYTGTLAAHGRATTLGSARPGDLIFYGGRFPYTHVAVYIGGGKVVSHGSEHGPIVTSASYRTISAIHSYLP